MDSDLIKKCFGDFVVGGCNRFAFIAAVSILDDIEYSKYNPFLLWGSAGQGKTRLLKAMEMGFQEKCPDKKVKYVTAEAFMNEYISTIQNGKYDVFRDKYRTVDCLLFDDVDHLENKSGIQTELYNTVVALIDSGKQLVVTTNRMPGDLDDILNPTLSVRLISGVVFGIDSPDYETRRKIAQKIIDRKEVKIDEKVVDSICAKQTENMNQFICVMNIICESIKYDAKEDMTVERAQKLLSLLDDGYHKREITADFIIDTVADFFGCTRHRILTGPNSFRKNYQRLVAIAVCTGLLDISTDRLEKYFGLIPSRGRIAMLTVDDPDFKRDVEAIKKNLITWESGADKNE